MFDLSGTTASDEATGEKLGEVLIDGERLLLVHGGRGGKGNQAFLSNRNRAPREADDRAYEQQR